MSEGAKHYVLAWGWQERMRSRHATFPEMVIALMDKRADGYTRTICWGNSDEADLDFDGLTDEERETLERVDYLATKAAT